MIDRTYQKRLVILTAYKPGHFGVGFFVYGREAYTARIFFRGRIMGENLQENKKTGWIKQYRSLQNHWLYKCKPFCKAMAWIDLELSASHNGSKFVLGNEIINLGRGELITSDRKLMQRWGWSKTKVREFLKLLQKDKMLTIKRDHKKTTLKLDNYCVYQDSQTTEKPKKDHLKTTKRPLRDPYNNVKEYIENDKEIKSLSEGARFTLNEKKIIFQNITGILIDDTELVSFKKAVDAVELSDMMIDEIAARVKQYFDVCMQRGWTKFVYGKKWESIRKYFAVFLSQDSLNFQYSQISAGNPPKKKAKGA